MASASEPPYVSRPLAEAIARSTSPVVLLEGPHGVGKTTLVRSEGALAHFHYVTLADEEELDRARRQPVEWVASLSRPAIIDDAHRLGSLLDAVLQVAPKKPVDEPFFVLVSPLALWTEEERQKADQAVAKEAPPAAPDPASLVSTTVSGAGPLALPAAPEGPADPAGDSQPATGSATERTPDGKDQGHHPEGSKGPKRPKKARKPLKPRHFSLFPLTQAELIGRPSCIVDDLFDHDPRPDFRTSCTLSDLRTMMRTGGLPRQAINPACPRPRQRSAEVRGQMRDMLDECSEPKDDMDRLVETSILKRVLGCPGLPLGVEEAARACYVDASTLTSHLGSFLDRFLVHRVPHLGKRNRKSAFSRTRIYPFDTTFAVEALLSFGLDVAVDPLAFGRVLRSLCVGQLVPAAQWASEPTECCHWKTPDRKARSVDLVLVRKDRIVALKVRNSSLVRSDRLGALGVLAKDARFVRGFVVYLGASAMQLAENIWAIPVSALWEPHAFHPLGEDDEGLSEAEAPDADVDDGDSDSDDEELDPDDGVDEAA